MTKEVSQTLDSMHDQQAVLCYENHMQDSRVKACGECSPQINAKAGTGGGNLPLVQSVGYYMSQHHSPQECDTPTLTTDNCATIRGDSPLVQTFPIDLRNGQRDADKKDSVNRQGIGVGKDGDPANTLSTVTCHGVAYNSTVRRLTPIECERLMGFPDNWTRIPFGRKEAKDCPDSPRYKACGNSMCVNVMQWIGARIQRVENIIKENEK